MPWNPLPTVTALASRVTSVPENVKDRVVQAHADAVGAVFAAVVEKAIGKGAHETRVITAAVAEVAGMTALNLVGHPAKDASDAVRSVVQLSRAALVGTWTEVATEVGKTTLAVAPYVPVVGEI